MGSLPYELEETYRALRRYLALSQDTVHQFNINFYGILFLSVQGRKLVNTIGNILVEVVLTIGIVYDLSFLHLSVHELLIVGQNFLFRSAMVPGNRHFAEQQIQPIPFELLGFNPIHHGRLVQMYEITVLCVGGV